MTRTRSSRSKTVYAALTTLICAVIGVAVLGSGRDWHISVVNSKQSVPTGVRPEVPTPTPANFAHTHLSDNGEAVVAQSSSATSTTAYIPSSFEAEWVDASRVGQICQLGAQQLERARLWLNYSAAVWQPKGLPPRRPTRQEGAVLSRMHNTDHNRGQPIEPLSGIARHPFARVGCADPKMNVDIFDITYLVLLNECSTDHQKKTGRALFFDLGCTTFGDGTARGASGAGPSIPLFYEMYKQRCVVFDEIYAWEAKPYNPTGWWKMVPEQLRPKLHFYNIPVLENTLAQSRASNYTRHGDPASPQASFLRFLAHAARPEDTVVLKIDIDGGPELQIVEAIAARPELYALVDEVFFEYHFYFDGKNFGWGVDPSPAGDGRHTVDNAVRLLAKLRKRGIRAHFWI